MTSTMKAILFAIIAIIPTFASDSNSNRTEIMLGGSSESISDCGSHCRFSLCDIDGEGDPVFLPKEEGLFFPPAFQATLPFICSSFFSRVGRILTTRQALVRIRSNRFVRIARLGRGNLTRTFNPRFYQVADLNVPQITGVSAVTRSKFRSMDQRRLLEGRCTILPIIAWEVMRADGTIARQVSARNPNNCVGFVSTGMTTMIKVTLHWDTAADFDLSLTEPDGTLVDLFAPQSPSGGFLFQDVLLGDCDINRGVRRTNEMIEYTGVATPQTGTYTISIFQNGICSESQKTNWDLYVQVGDETVLVEGGVVDGTTNEVGPFTFTFP